MLSWMWVFFHDPGNVSCAPGSDVVRCFTCWSSGGGGGGSPSRSEALLGQVSSPASVSSPGCYPSSPVLRSTPDVSPPSGLAAMDQDLPWSASLAVGVSADSPLLPVPLTPHRMVAGMVVPGSVVSSPPGDTDVAGGRRGCQICLWRAPLTFIRTGRRLVSLHGCWMVCGLPIPHDIVRSGIWWSGLQSRIWDPTTQPAAVGVCGCAGVGSTTQP